MPNYRVGVTLGLRGSGYTTGIKGAASQTERFGGVVARTARSSTSQLRRTAGAAADVGNALGRTARRSRGALQRVAGAAAGVTSALGRTASAARRVGTASRRMADSMGAALGRARSRVDGLIGRFRVFEAHQTGAAAAAWAGAGVLGGCSAWRVEHMAPAGWYSKKLTSRRGTSRWPAVPGARLQPQICRPRSKPAPMPGARHARSTVGGRGGRTGTDRRHGADPGGSWKGSRGCCGWTRARHP